jgi:hypothetical protein
MFTSAKKIFLYSKNVCQVDKFYGYFYRDSKKSEAAVSFVIVNQDVYYYSQVGLEKAS